MTDEYSTLEVDSGASLLNFPQAQRTFALDVSSAHPQAPIQSPK